eukprot:CAMPEP_0113500472 /NCGR_PEP_ID=MMETSP0014_2-20120614/32350_1 /TAXON_ID=2857 /ORGANISM="Nitzschia sp." /LENGTH=64 /DNA_ID=CAMNT_0000394817 /DNA_START=68 /DNA_END=259 /DNA_ORIENTATION=- /assembly_acc=CAM_ASM_000159
MTCAPADANAAAILRPSPDDAPVTNAVFPVKSKSPELCAPPEPPRAILAVDKNLRPHVIIVLLV